MKSINQFCTLIFLLCILSREVNSVEYLPINIPNFNNYEQLIQSQKKQETKAPIKKVIPAPPKEQKFNDVILDHQIPDIFIQGEVFIFTGKVNATKMNLYKSRYSYGQETYPITVVFLNNENSQRLTFITQLQYGKTQFSVQCYLTQKGKYKIGIFLGESGPVSTKIYEVRESSQIQFEEQNTDEGTNETKIEEQEQEQYAPTNMQFEVKENDFYIKWQRKTSLTKIEFSQNKPNRITQTFIISNDNGNFKIPYSAFQNFTETQTQIQISHAQSSGVGAYTRKSKFSKPFKRVINVTEHHFREVKLNQLQINGQLPSKVQLNDTIKIKGKSKQKIYQTAIIIEPDKLIKDKSINLNSEDGKYLQPQSDFELEQVAQKQGVYIIEINHSKGYALINIPVYVGQSYPLLPDYHDLSPLHFVPSRANKDVPKTLNEQRQFLLKLINQKRKQFKVPPLQLDDKLNELAQKHSQDMARRVYASHTNLRGQGSAARARKMGIYTPIGENIAVNADIEYAQYRLARSPVHLKNIINQNWKRVGVGISLGPNFLYYITQQFSTRDTQKQFSQQEQKSLKQMLLQGIQEGIPQKFTQNKELSKELQKWHEQAGLSATHAIRSVLNRARILKSSVLITTVPYTERFVTLLKNEGYLTDLGKYNIGVTLKVVKGLIQIVVVYY